jgi:hypothetical protein
MNVEIGTETPIFLFWEYLFRNFGVLSLQCRVQETRIYPFLTKLDTSGYQVGTLNQNLFVPYKVGYIWVPGGHIEPEFIHSLQSWTHLDIRWVQGTRIYPFFTKLDTSGYQVGTGNKDLSVSYKVGYIWVPGGYMETE